MASQVSVLVSSDGVLDTTALNPIQDDSEASITTLTAFGAYNLSQNNLLDQLFATAFSDAPTEGICAALVRGDDSAVLNDSPHDILVLSLEPFDGPDRTREEQRERACHLGLALSDALLFIVRMHDLPRVQTNGISAMQGSITQMLMLQADDVTETPSEKRAFIVIVKDYEADVLSRQEVINGFLQEMQTVYKNVAKPPRSPQLVTEVFEFEFLLLPNERLTPNEYQEAIADVRTRLLDPFSDNYLFEAGRYSIARSDSTTETAKEAWKKLDVSQNADVPPMKDLMSSFDCDNAMRKVFEKYQRSVRVWKREADGGGIIENFGQAASTLVRDTISVFDRDAAPHKGSKAFKRKKDELKDLLDADLYNLFVVQIAKLREVTYRIFKEKLDAFSDSEPRLERSVNAAVRESQKSFRANAEALRPGFSSWRYDNDAKELANHMREDATERLQRARIADYQESGLRGSRRRRSGAGDVGGRKSRQPINVSIHYLDPAPFGWKDSRYEKLGADDTLEFHGNSSIALGTGKGGGLTVPLEPPRDSAWQQRNQDFIYTERR
ncbi:Protein SEY1 [Gracilariopsis chorda]|uniref:Protein SEY1 n=1 Tax=Gracilariopsis chorda TaxID=448386 RepID=A0A2V3IXC7_9FLOR|nr:Protein SEY1 [Gracilariopsis chorda]|eukprot:PXF46347.1 Protein SEY1 [Gracilariopsis chorda]